MRSLCTCAALAVATAFAHGHFTDALLRSNAMQRQEGAVTQKQFEALVEDCREKINQYRKLLSQDAKEYQKNSDVTQQTEVADLKEFLTDKTCTALESGDFDPVASDGESGKIFVITAKQPEEGGHTWADDCAPALKQWHTGFSAFEGKYPPTYEYPSQKKEGATPYADPNAAALASLLQTGQKQIACGTLTDCQETNLLLCYLKPVEATGNPIPVDPKLWHALEAQEKLKPTLGKEDEEGDATDILKAVNDARDALGLKGFTSPEDPKSLKRVKRSARADTTTIQDAVKEFLYTLTCDNIINSNIDPAPSDKDFTVIYYIKDGERAPTMEEAVTYWQSGFDKLQYKRPPAFKKATTQAQTESGTTDPAVEASKIYSDSAVAGYVSIMTDDTRTMACVVATGCEASDAAAANTEGTTTSKKKSGLVCLVHTATLKNDEEPISKDTWAKIMEQKGYPLPKFQKLGEDANCLQEMNAVRTQEKLGLKAFVASPATKTDISLELSSLMQNVTCPAIGGAAAAKTETTTGPEFKITDGTTSLMYHSVADVTCSAAVEAWKKGSEKFTTAPPAYKSDVDVYKDAAATNFVSLITDKATTTTATCYSTGCATAGIVCELSAAALVEGEKPVSEDTWTKYSEIGETSGVAGVSKAALIGTVVMALAAGVFFL